MVQTQLTTLYTNCISSKLCSDIREQLDTTKKILDPVFARKPIMKLEASVNLNDLYEVLGDLSVGARCRLAMLFAKRGDLKTSSCILEGVDYKTDLIIAVSYLDYAFVYLANGDEENAFKVIEECYSKFPGQQNLYSQLSWLYFLDRMNFEKCVEFCNKDFCAGRMPDFFLPYFALVYSKINDGKGAQEVLAKYNAKCIGPHVPIVINHLIWGDKIEDAHAIFSRFKYELYAHEKTRAHFDALAVYFGEKTLEIGINCVPSYKIAMADSLWWLGLLEESKITILSIDCSSVSHATLNSTRYFNILLRHKLFAECGAFLDHVKAENIGAVPTKSLEITYYRENALSEESCELLDIIAHDDFPFLVQDVAVAVNVSDKKYESLILKLDRAIKESLFVKDKYSLFYWKAVYLEKLSRSDEALFIYEQLLSDSQVWFKYWRIALIYKAMGDTCKYNSYLDQAKRFPHEFNLSVSNDSCSDILQRTPFWYHLSDLYISSLDQK